MSAIIRHISREDYRDKFIDGKYRGKLFYSLIFLIVVMVVSCGKSSPPPTTPLEERKEIVGIYMTSDTVIRLDALLLVVNVDTFFNGKDAYFKHDSIVGRPHFFEQIDSAGKPSIDSASGKPIMVKGWMQISKDSVLLLSSLSTDSISNLLKNKITDGKK